MSQIGYRNKLFDMNVMELSQVKLDNNIKNQLITVLMKCRKEMK